MAEPPLCHYLGLVPTAQDIHRAGKGTWEPAQIVGQTQLGVLPLPGPRLSLKLLVYFIDHPRPTGTNGMTKALQATIDVECDVPFSIETAFLNVVLTFASGGKLQVLVD